MGGGGSPLWALNHLSLSRLELCFLTPFQLEVLTLSLFLFNPLPLCLSCHPVFPHLTPFPQGLLTKHSTSSQMLISSATCTWVSFAPLSGALERESPLCVAGSFLSHLLVGFKSVPVGAMTRVGGESPAQCRTFIPPANAD